ncbi:MAG: MBL fold metallo-hydrolase [Rhodospirillales bacterium]|nr:MBL fold metallo-hydrolase [Rhodospirillales bacterium]
MTFSVKFWGVRGSIACASPAHMRYGGNTSCIEVVADGYRIILDAGTGIRQLGNEMLKSGAEDFHILLTHTHWDHINGFPFFAPAYNKDLKIEILAGHLNDKGGVENVLSAQMDNPMFPAPLEAMVAQINFNDFDAGKSFDLTDKVHVRTAPLRHPNDATAYRIEFDGLSVVYVTDTEHVIGETDMNVFNIIKDADLVIYDCTYTEEEFPSKIGWGHSTWNEGVRLCMEADVKRLAIFHHEPDHYDDFMDQIAIDAKAVWPGTFVSREGMCIDMYDLDAIDNL